MTSQTVDFAKGDDLADLIGGTARTADQLPQAPEFARIRAEVPSFTETCPACKGTGRFTSWSGRVLGQCFKCKGAGNRTFKTAPAARAQARTSAADRSERARVANGEAFAAAHPEAWAWLLANSGSPTFEFPAKMVEAVHKFGQLTVGQFQAVERLMARAQERTAQRAVVAQVAAQVTFPNLQAAFDALLAKGVRRAQMTAGDLNFSLAGLGGKNPGAVYVKDAGEYAGKIVGGTFRPDRTAKADLIARLAIVEADPRAAVVAHARMTAERLAAAQANGETLALPCGCCGKTLSDPVSVERGIGPVCAEKWDF